MLLKHIAYHTWDKEGKRLNTETALEATSPKWDGGFVICGINTNGEWWAVRDSHGIRPAFWYADDEKVVVASEKIRHLTIGRYRSLGNQAAHAGSDDQSQQ